jgi:S-adenosylmethionine hydrolase
MQLVTLTTDFGNKDWFVGTMKGVILNIAPQAMLVDITHEIPPGDIRAGAFALAASYRFFPKGTIHLAVVDPGVGSDRRAIVAQTANYVFVGPDNGVLSWALSQEKIKAIHALENEKYFLHPISLTFHGRDIFAPVAAHLARGMAVSKLGPALKQLVNLPMPKPRRRDNRIEGEVLYIDRFGNAITNLSGDYLAYSTKAVCEIYGKRPRLCQFGSFYQAVPAGKPIALVGSSSFVEIAINGGSAEKVLGVRPGTRVVLRNRT